MSSRSFREGLWLMAILLNCGSLLSACVAGDIAKALLFVCLCAFLTIVRKQFVNAGGLL